MTMISAEHLADAYEAIAKANHYLVGIVCRDSLDWGDFEAAEQILIGRQNCYRENTRTWRTLNLALDCLAYDRKRLGV